MDIGVKDRYCHVLHGLYLRMSGAATRYRVLSTSYVTNISSIGIVPSLVSQSA